MSAVTHAGVGAYLCEGRSCVLFVAIVDIPQGADSGGNAGRTF